MPSGKTLLVLRHAKSSWDFPDLDDHDRPLNARGRRAAPRMGQLLAEEDLVPDLVLSSTAVRARTTVELALDAADCGPPVVLDESLYPTYPEVVEELLRAVSDDHERVMIVGHNPGLEALIEAVTETLERFPTAALAHIRLPIDRWGDFELDGRGELANLWLPRELDGSR
jgi:phosphohistidine phosphatase